MSFSSQGILDAKDHQSFDALIELSLTSADYVDQFIPYIKSELASKESLTDLITKLEKSSTEKQNKLDDVSLESIDDLESSLSTIKRIAETSKDISGQVITINKQYSKTGLNLVKIKKDALKYDQLQSTIHDTSSTLSNCLDILDKTNRVFDLSEAGQYYKALVNLELITKMRVEETDQYDFIKHIYSSLPAIKKMIVERTLGELRRSLAIVERKEIGESIFNNFDKINERWYNVQANDHSVTKYKVNSPVELAMRNPELASFDPLDSSNLDHQDSDRLTKLYNCLLVFQSLNDFERLRLEFGNELTRRRDRIIGNIKNNLDSNNLDIYHSNESLKDDIYSFVTFFILDRIFTSVIEYPIRTPKQTDDLYSSVLTKFLPVLKHYVKNHSSNIDELKELNYLLGTFCQILDYWKFDNNAIYDVLLDVFESYINLLIKDFSNTYISLSEKDSLQAFVVESENIYNGLREKCFYLFKDSDKRFPKTLPFSFVYPATCVKLRDLITNIYEFLGKYYNKKIVKITKMIGKAIDDVLTKVVLKELRLKNESTFKEVISQNLINLEFFANSILEIEKYLNFSSDPMIERTRISSCEIKLTTEPLFRQTKHEAEESVFALVDSKVESLLEMVEFTWDSSNINVEPEDSIKELGMYIDNIFLLDFSHLPYSIKTLLLIRTFDRLVTQFKSLLFLADDITTESVLNFKTDIEYVEGVITSLKKGQDDNIVDFNNSNNLSLQEMVVGLNQLVDLLKEGNMEAYTDETIRQRRFNTIKPDEAQELIGKLVEYKEMKRREAEELLHSRTPSQGYEDETRSIFHSLRRNGTSGSFIPSPKSASPKYFNFNFSKNSQERKV